MVEYQRFRYRQVLKTLQKLADNGEVEGLHDRRPGVHGELAYIEGRLTGEMTEELRLCLVRRRNELLVARDALYATLRQFDAALDPTGIGAVEDWLKPYGRGVAGRNRYDAARLQPLD